MTSTLNEIGGKFNQMGQTNLETNE